MSAKEFMDQVTVLRQERDVARSERDLMERMYHGSLGTAENCSKLNLALKEWQLQSMPAVRAVREILNQRPELKGPDGIVRAVLNGKSTGGNGGNGGAGGLPPGESVCVGERIVQPDGGAFLRCTNCAIVVAKLSQEQMRLLNFPDPDGLQAHWQQEWVEHTRSKTNHLSPALSPKGGEGEESAAVVICTCVCQLCKRGVHCDRGCCRVENPNPNAGVKQAYPKGRWSR